MFAVMQRVAWVRQRQLILVIVKVIIYFITKLVNMFVNMAYGRHVNYREALFE